MKKTFSILFILLLSITLFACNKNNGKFTTNESSGNGSGTTTEGVNPGEKEGLTSPNIVFKTDDSDPNYLDGNKFEYIGVWGNEEYPKFNLDYRFAGLYNPDGTVYTMPNENESSGQRIMVTDHGAVADDPDFDNTPAVKQAIAAAEPGDYIYFPRGSYYFKTQSIAKPVMAHISLPSGVNLVGAGRDHTFLISQFSAYDNEHNPTAMIGIVSEENITISGVTITAQVPEEKMPQPEPDTGKLSTTKNNPEGNKFVPKYGIRAINNEIDFITQNIVVKDVIVEYFSVSGIEFTNTIASTVKDSIIKNSTDIGGGGRGYGVTIQGFGNEAFHTVGTNLGSRYNVVKNVTVEGPYIRHGIILSYLTHNNLIYNNTITESQDQPLDMHGEDEFLNVFVKNTVKDGASSAIGLGNPGSTHDATGPANIVYGNIVDNFLGGIEISHGTPDTVILNNKITNLRENSIGIDLMFAPNTLVRNNEIDTIPGELAAGIIVKYSYVYYEPALGVSSVFIRDNVIKNIHDGVGIKLDAYGDNSKILENQFVDVKTDIEDNNANFVVPEKSDYTTEVVGKITYPVKEANINRGSWNNVVANRGYFWFKGSHNEREFNRMIYYDWDLTKLSADISDAEKIVIRLTVTSKSALQRIAFHGIENFHEKWDESTMTWGNAPFVNNPVNNSELEIDPSGIYSTLNYPYLAEVYDPEEELSFIRDFQVVAIDEAFITYYIDITDYVKSLDTGRFTMILSNPTADEAYSSIRNMIGNRKEIWPAIIIADKE